MHALNKDAIVGRLSTAFPTPIGMDRYLSSVPTFCAPSCRAFSFESNLKTIRCSHLISTFNLNQCPLTCQVFVEPCERQASKRRVRRTASAGISTSGTSRVRQWESTKSTEMSRRVRNTTQGKIRAQEKCGCMPAWQVCADRRLAREHE